MAESERKNVAVYRSVSFKKLGSWSANRSAEQRPPQRKSVELEAAGVALPTERATRNVSVSRKVSKISSTSASATAAGLPTAEPRRGSSTPLSSISPSIRQLTERFASSSGTRAAPPADGVAVTRRSSTLPRPRCSRRAGSPARKSFHEDSRSFRQRDTAATAAESPANNKAQKFHSGTDSVSGSDSEKKQQRRLSRRLSNDSSSDSGKRDYSHISASDPRKTLTAEEEEDVTGGRVPSPCKSRRSYHSAHHSEFIPLHSDKWPSVTKIRQIFDERQSKATTQQQQPKTDSWESLKVAGGGHIPELSRSESAPLPDRGDGALPSSSPGDASSLSLHGKRIAGAQSREERALGEDFCYGADYQGYSNDEEAEIESRRARKNNLSGGHSLQSGSSRSCTGGSYYQRINTSPIRSHSPSAEAQAAHRTLRTTGLTSDPGSDLQPPATSSLSRSESPDTSSCLSSLQQPTARERRDRQGVGLPRDSLHSSHSSSRAPAPTSSSPPSASTPDKAITSCSSTAAPSTGPGAPARVASPLGPRWRLSSGDEEEEHARRRKESSGGGFSVPSGPASSVPGRLLERSTKERGGSHLSSSKNGWWGTKGVGRSSGSEEDSPSSLVPHGREAVRRRSLRKKKKASGASLAAGRDDYDDDHDGESDDSDSDAVTMEQIERQQQQNTGGELAGTRPRSHSAREPSSHSHRARVQQWERIFSPATSTTLPGLSRVSKVNIPSFLSSPGGSRCSSRYSSTETLKEEDQASGANRAAHSRASSSSVLSKTYHGNFTMYRSPSFGHGDNFSRAPVRVRPKVVPTVTPIPNVLARETGASTGVRRCESMAGKARGGADADKNRISMSNPDITSETMSLLSFLKSDLSELKVRKTTGDKSGVVEGPAVYRMGSRTHGGTLLPSGCRPSLKDLTATLRRTKSFTYTDKPSTGVRCYLTGGSAKRSASEQQLDQDGERDGGRVSDREVESDGGDFRVGRGRRFRDYRFDDDDDDDEVISPFHERYVQEARQVIRDICQMSSREDDDADVSRTDDTLQDECLLVKKTKEEKEKAGLSAEDEARTDQEAELKSTKDRDKHERERENRERERSKRDGQSMQLGKLNSRGTDFGQKVKRQSREPERALLKGDSEENMFYERSVDELSGHESSLTDEGIVTEPEMGPGDASEKSFLGSAGVNLGSRIARDVHGQPVTIWKQSALHDMEGLKKEREDMTENTMNGTNCLNEVSAPPSLLVPARMVDRDSTIMELSGSADSNDVNACSEDINTNSAVPQRSAGTAGGGGGVEAPATPSANRRRRKFTPHGNNNNNTGGDSVNGGNAESTIEVAGNGESTVYRSLSDPMPQRCCSVAEEGNNNFSSVDSNLLGSLSVKGGGGGGGCSPEASVSEYRGSMASDLSVYSDGGLRDDALHDYSGMIRSIVAEPGAMDRLMAEDHSSGKTPKKKSFSDPSRRSDAPLLLQNDPQFKGQAGSTEPICELDQSGQIPPSSSEPILSEQREELWEPDVEPDHPSPPQQLLHPDTAKIARKGRSLSECTPHSDDLDDKDDDAADQGVDEKEMHKFNFESKLAGILSPRMVRRPGRKRPNRLAQFFSHEDPFEPPELGSVVHGDHRCRTDLTPPLPLLPLQSSLRSRPKHVRHASEPTTFIPISPPPHLQPVKEADCLSTQPTTQPPTLGKPSGEEAPSLEDVTQKYILELNTSERDAEGPGPLAAARDGTSVSGSERPGETSTGGITEAGPQKKCTEDTAAMAPTQKAKPRVVSPRFFFPYSHP